MTLEMRFDHGAIAVRDLESAIRVFRDELGFDTRHGGRHGGRGTENAIIRFPGNYIELLSLHDPEKEIAVSGERGRVLAEFIGKRAGGHIGYALSVDDVARHANALQRAGLDVPDPKPVSRTLPGGQVLRWKVLLPGGVNWRRPWPFLIESDPANAALRAEEPPGSHPIGVTGILGVSVAVKELEQGRDLYGRQLGLQPAGEDRVPELGAARARFALGTLRVDVLAPIEQGVVHAELESVGEGVFALLVSVADMNAAQAWLARSGISPQSAPGYPDARLIPPERAVGARIILARA